MPQLMTPNEQFQALNIVDYLIDLFAASPKQTFSKAEVIGVLEAVGTDPDFFASDVMLAQVIATADIDSQSSAPAVELGHDHN